MSDSSPEDFMEQALALITELKKALTESFSAQDKRIDAIIKVLGEQVATQQQSIDKNATDFTSLNKLFEGHTHSNYVNQSYVNRAITDHAQSHKQELQNIKKKFISIEIYDAQIKALNAEIAALRTQIGNIPQSTALTEGVTGATEVTETPKPKYDDAQIDTDNQLSEQFGETAPSDDSGEGNTTREDSASSEQSNPLPDRSPQAEVAQPDQHTTPPSATSATIYAEHDPNVSDLKTAILQAILKSAVYQSIESNKRGDILKKANDIKKSNTSTVNDNALHMQVILALHFFRNKPRKKNNQNESIRNNSRKKNNQNESIPLYRGCYNDDGSKLTELTNIIKDFIGENDLIVTGATFKDAVDDKKNFNLIMTPHAVDGADYAKFKTDIQAGAN